MLGSHCTGGSRCNTHQGKGDLRLCIQTRVSGREAHFKLALCQRADWVVTRLFINVTAVGTAVGGGLSVGDYEFDDKCMIDCLATERVGWKL